MLGQSMFQVLFVNSKYQIVLISDYKTISVEVSEPKDCYIKQIHWWELSIFCKLVL